MTRYQPTKDRTVANLEHAFAEVSALDPHQIARQGALLSLRAKAVGPLIAMIEQCLEWLVDVELAYGDADLALADGFAAGDVDFDGWVLAADSRLGERAAATVADICFAARCDLMAQLRRLRDAAGAPDALLQECDAAATKVRRALRAVLDGMAERSTSAVVAPPAIETVERREVEIAVAVRAMFARLRGAVLPVPANDPESLTGALEELSRTLRSIVGSPEFDFVRADDQARLRELAAAADAWLAGERNPRRGGCLYEDIVATADGLRAINLRFELVAHDSAVVGEARDALAGDATPMTRDDFDLLVERMWSLRGRDDAFDQLLGRAIAGESPPRLAQLFAHQLDVMARHLGVADPGTRC